MIRRLSLLLITLCVLGAGLCSALGVATARAAALPETLVPLTITLADSATGAPLGVRLSVLDDAAKPRWPSDPLAFYHATILGFFYCRGTCTVLVPPGRVIITARRGLAYRPHADTLTVTTATSHTMTMARWIDLPALSLWTGDTHVHLDHGGGDFLVTPADAWWMGQGEGLNVVSCLDNAWYFTGADDPASTSDCIVSMGEENRAWVYGHVSMLGLSRLVQPVSGEPYWPMLMDLADSAHAQGALTIAAHPLTDGWFYITGGWPGSGIARELPADLYRGRIDAIDIASYSNYAGHGIDLSTWYHALGCGFRLAPSAGTDAAMNRYTDPPLGGWQVVVGLDGQPFDFATWRAQLKRGRCFVTNGPLFTDFRVAGAPAGDSVALASPGIVQVHVTVRSLDPLARLDLVANGAVARAIALPAGTTTVDTTVTIDVPVSSWIAARVTGRVPSVRTPGDSLFAHTGAAYVTVGGSPVLVPADASYFASWCDGMRTVLDLNHSWPSSADSVRAYAEIDAAHAYYIDLASGGATRVDAPVGHTGALRLVSPARGHVAFDLAPLPARATLVVLDATGRAVRHLPLARGTRHAVWDGTSDAGATMPAGVYWARLAPHGAVRVVFVR